MILLMLTLYIKEHNMNYNYLLDCSSQRSLLLVITGICEFFELLHCAHRYG